MREALIVLIFVCWPLTFVMMAVGTGRWYWELSIVGTVIFLVLVSVIPKISNRVKLYFLGLIVVFMAASNISLISYIYAIFIPLLGISYLIFSKISKAHEKILRVTYLSMTVPYVCLGVSCYFINELTMYLYYTFILQEPVVLMPKSLSYSYLDALWSAFIVVVLTLPSLGSVIAFYFYSERNA